MATPDQTSPRRDLDQSESDSFPEQPSQRLGFDKGRRTVVNERNILIVSFEDRAGIRSTLDELEADPTLSDDERARVRELKDTLRPGNEGRTFTQAMRDEEEEPPSVLRGTWRDVDLLIRSWS